MDTVVVVVAAAIVMEAIVVAAAAAAIVTMVAVATAMEAADAAHMLVSQRTLVTLSQKPNRKTNSQDVWIMALKCLWSKLRG